MNPRHRRLLIPGLLIALLVIVIVSSVAGRSDAATTEPSTVSTLTDPRINESSGLVMSAGDPDRVFTINDSGGTPVVYTIDVSSGETVGTVTIDADLVDTEALSSDGDGTLWVADTGDNRSVRSDVALYSIAEPGDGDGGSVTARRYPITYPGGALDVEALVIQPGTGKKFLISKGLFGGTVFALPDELVEDQPNEATTLAGSIPGLVTDAAFTPDGRFVVARDYSEAYVLDPVTWEIVASMDLPELEQGETLAMEAGGRSFLVGSEGTRSPLIRIPFTPPETQTPDGAAATPSPAASPAASAPGSAGFAGATWFWAALVVGLLAVISVAASRQG